MFAGAPAAGGRVVIKPAPYYTHSLRAAAGPPRAARAPLLESPYYLGKGSFNPCTNLLCSTSKLWWRAVLFVWYDLSASTDPPLFVCGAAALRRPAGAERGVTRRRSCLCNAPRALLHPFINVCFANFCVAVLSLANAHLFIDCECTTRC